MKSLRVSRKKLLLAGVVILLLGGVVITSVFIHNSRKEKEAEEKAQASVEVEEYTHKRTDYSAQEIVGMAPDPDYAFNRLFSVADIAEETGEIDKAESYLVEAVNQAKLTNSQETIDAGYRLLIAFYQRQKNQSKLDELKGTLGEEKFRMISTPEESPYL